MQMYLEEQPDQIIVSEREVSMKVRETHLWNTETHIWLLHQWKPMRLAWLGRELATFVNPKTHIRPT
jgi:hypothetical protein